MDGDREWDPHSERASEAAAVVDVRNAGINAVLRPVAASTARRDNPTLTVVASADRT
jgi:hypothetical protein